MRMVRKLMTHLYYGDPNEEFSLKLAETLLTSGADILEVGIAYTDPVCDGEVFQRACKRVLVNGVTPLKALNGIKNIREKGYKNPIYLTSYYAPVYKIGLEKFVSLAKKAGVTGLIIPDLLLEEQQSIRRLTDKYSLSLIQLATVYSTEERLKEIIEASTGLPAGKAGFIYCVSLPGVTGDETNFSKSLKSLKLLKSLTNNKIFVGFGIQNRDEVQKILEMGADGVIVGSAIARIYEDYLEYPDTSLLQISQFIKSLKESTI